MFLYKNRQAYAMSKLKATTDGTSGCVKIDIWCQRGAWQSPGAGPYLLVLLVYHKLCSACPLSSHTPELTPTLGAH